MLTKQAPFKGSPAKGCRKCPRLVQYRQANRKTNPEWENSAIHPWGSPSAKLLILGLAPGLKGANRTGRVFTGDGAGNFLFEQLTIAGFVEGSYSDTGLDDLTPNSVAITNAVACVPPENKPTPEEQRNCLPFLTRQIRNMPELRAILCLGHLAHRACINALGLTQREYPFAHGHYHQANLKPDAPNLAIFDSYHCSRYNTQTGRLTADMFITVLREVKSYIDESR